MLLTSVVYSRPICHRLLPTGDLVCVPLVLFGFSFLVVVEIGSLARFTCFSNVDLSWIF